MAQHVAERAASTKRSGVLRRGVAYRVVADLDPDGLEAGALQQRAQLVAVDPEGDALARPRMRSNGGSASTARAPPPAR
jgi:hypothetical protein